MKTIFKKITCLFLVVLMALSLFACGQGGNNGGKNDKDSAAKFDKNTVYKTQELNIPFPEGFNVNNTFFVDGKIYCNGNVWNDVTYESKQQWLTCNLDGTDLSVHDINLENGWVGTFVVLKGGNVITSVNESYEDYSESGEYNFIQKEYLISFDNKGNELARIDMNEKYDIEWFNSIVALNDGNILVDCGSRVFILDEKLNVVKDKKRDNDAYYNYYTIKDGSVLVRYYDENDKVAFAKFNTDTFEIGEKLELSIDTYNMTVLNGGGVYDFLLFDSTQLYGYNVTDSDKTPLMNFLNSDLPNSYFSTISFDSDGSLIGIYNDWDSDEYRTVVCKYTKVDPETIPDKKVLTLGCVWINNDVRKQIIKFNKDHDDVRITIKDYSQYNSMDEWDAGVVKLNSDIASGKAPDIIVAQNGSDIQNYVAKGLFADLNKFIKNDPDVDYDDLFPNLIEACSYNGKLYQIAPSFYIQTALGKTSVLGGRESWTLDEYIQFAKTIPEGSVMFPEMTRDNMLYNMLSINVSDFMDVTKAKCYFDSPEFISLLEYLKTLPTEDELYTDDYWDNYNYEENQAQYRTNKAILMAYTLYSPNDLKYLIHGNFGEDVTFIGFPCKEGNGSSIVLDSTYAISSKCKNQEAAWEFVKYFIGKDYLSQQNWSIPASMSKFDEMCEDLKKKPYYEDNGQIIEYDDTYYINGQEVVLQPFTQEEIDKIKAFVCSVNKIGAYSEDIETIITEDSEPFFAGQKSAEECVKIIQSRATIMLNEKQ